jgi:UDP-3-O-[3-hydroxymyristoyl] glucosamine N-acyltransferase
MITKPVPLGEIAEAVGGIVRGDPEFMISGACTLDRPIDGHLAYAKTVERIEQRDLAGASIAILTPSSVAASSLSLILVENPRYAFAQIVHRFFVPDRILEISPAAHIADTARIGHRVSIGPGCVIGPFAEIGDECELRANVVVGANVKIGARCLIKSNSVIGEEGFGFEASPDGRYLRIPHLGSVIIADDVEIGSLNTVVRGTIEDTVVGEGTKTDDHVHIAHNCQIGRNVIITAHAELSGSVIVADDVWIGPNAALMNGITIECGTLIGIGAIISKSTVKNGVYPGARSKLLRVKSSTKPA